MLMIIATLFATPVAYMLGAVALAYCAIALLGVYGTLRTASRKRVGGLTFYKVGRYGVTTYRTRG